MTSQSGKQTITIRILHNISRGKGNQAMKSGQFVKYNITNIFLEKSCTKCNRETFTDSFPKNVLGIFPNQQFIFIAC